MRRRNTSVLVLFIACSLVVPFPCFPLSLTILCFASFQLFPLACSFSGLLPSLVPSQSTFCCLVLYFARSIYWSYLPRLAASRFPRPLPLLAPFQSSFLTSIFPDQDVTYISLLASFQPLSLACLVASYQVSSVTCSLSSPFPSFVPTQFPASFYSFPVLSHFLALCQPHLLVAHSQDGCQAFPFQCSFPDLLLPSPFPCLLLSGTFP